MIALLTLILGLLGGFYARQVYDMLKVIYDDYIERKQASQAGVVRPIKRLDTKSQPIDLSTGSGVVLRPTPTQAGLSEIAAQRERNERLKRQ